MSIQGEHHIQGSLSIRRLRRQPLPDLKLNYIRFLQLLLLGVSTNAVEGDSDELLLFRLEMGRVAGEMVEARRNLSLPASVPSDRSGTPI